MWASPFTLLTAAMLSCFLLFSVEAASITFIGVEMDIIDFSGFGNEGYWMPGFACSSYQSGQRTDHNEHNTLHSWTGPLKHIERWELKEYVNRSFSMDGPCSVTCGDINFSTITLPDSTTGLSGIVIDPAAAENSNNSINRITLNTGTPSSFIFSILVDNANVHHSAINKIAARGEHLLEPIEPDTSPSPGAAGFNGVPDLYRFRFDGFVPGDYIKVKFNGEDDGSLINKNQNEGSSFGGIFFDLPGMP